MNINKKIDCIMLIDDNQDDNFFHERVIKKVDCTNNIVTKLSGNEALDYLKSDALSPDLILLDINMPGMNGWEFLEEYKKLKPKLQRQVIIIMLTTSTNPNDKAKAIESNITSDFLTKPLTKEMLYKIFKEYFPDYL